MAYSGYLIKVGGTNGTALPFSYLRYDTYNVTKHTLDLDTLRDTGGYLHRHPVDHTPVDVSFNIPSMNNTQAENVMSLFRAAMNNTTERKVKLRVFVPEINGYIEDDFYMPDPKFHIIKADATHVEYGETTLEFIGY